MFELIINILLFIFLGFTFFTHVLEAAVPASVARNPYALQPDVWPKTIIILLEICLIVNIIKIIKKTLLFQILSTDTGNIHQTDVFISFPFAVYLPPHSKILLISILHKTAICPLFKAYIGNLGIKSSMTAVIRPISINYF